MPSFVPKMVPYLQSVAHKKTRCLRITVRFPKCRTLRLLSYETVLGAWTSTVLDDDIPTVD